ncbi:MAG: DUF58 domain-containing protein [Methanoregulaceae archaeon]|nr:DUF58 domain-containing protein [Methanoregulaceae archaeon]
MQGRRVTYGIAALGTALALVSWLFDDPVIFSLASVLIAFVASRGVLFTLHLHSLVNGLEFSRTANKEIVRQGGTVDITVRCRAGRPGRPEIFLRDIIPPGAVLKTGSPGGWIGPDLSYSLGMMTGGPASFPGAELFVQDRFFSTRILCASARFRTPLIHTEPFSAFAPAEAVRTTGEENEKDLPFSPGHGVRSFREYVTGDDPRNIDWKLTAKHDRLYVRDYGGVTGRPPLIVLDLPEGPGGDVSDSLKGAVARLAGEAASESGGGHLLVISGANVIRSVRFGVHTGPVREALTGTGPAVRLVHLYRYTDAPAVRHIARRIETIPGPAPGDLPYLSRLSGICTEFSGSVRPVAFVSQVRRVLAAAPRTDLFLFSGFEGDRSHLWQVVFEAKRHRFPVYVRVPALQATPGLLREIARADPAGVGVIA